MPQAFVPLPFRHAGRVLHGANNPVNHERCAGVSELVLSGFLEECLPFWNSVRDIRGRASVRAEPQAR